ncbi:hypothetical protein PmNV_035 [Penaeus monodon nudivirus]|uniref:Uncharacterized protein n=1 Tax=Penaeus monodon nudivirus TaxID=1529056 RepID=A0A076FCY7_9VIRU|nr:hypothetical protein PmNV_035 [Penaeus monodon nudivirus]AII15823.1 hypothetical protein PmNV_035 [Penaeus monodon nudivirus]
MNPINRDIMEEVMNIPIEEVAENQVVPGQHQMEVPTTDNTIYSDGTELATDAMIGNFLNNPSAEPILDDVGDLAELECEELTSQPLLPAEPIDISLESFKQRFVSIINYEMKDCTTLADTTDKMANAFRSLRLQLLNHIKEDFLDSDSCKNYNWYVIGFSIFKFIYAQTYQLKNLAGVEAFTSCRLRQNLYCDADPYCMIDSLRLDLSVIGFNENWLMRNIRECYATRNFPREFIEQEITFIDQSHFDFDSVMHMTLSRKSKEVYVKPLYAFIMETLRPVMNSITLDKIIAPCQWAKFRYDNIKDTYEMKFLLNKKELDTNMANGRHTTMSIKTSVELPIDSVIGVYFHFDDTDKIIKSYYTQAGVRVALNYSKNSRLEFEFEKLDSHSMECIIGRFKFALVNNILSVWLKDQSIEVSTTVTANSEDTQYADLYE